MMLRIQLYWQSKNKSSILWFGLCAPRCVVHRFVALMSWWIAPRVPIPRSGLHCSPDCCLIGAEMCVKDDSVKYWLGFDQRVSSQELSLVKLGSFQDVSFCLIEASRRINQLQLLDQCLLVDQAVHQPT